MPDYVIRTGSDPVAEQLLHGLENKGFQVFDHELANAATLLVFNTNRVKLKRAIRDMNLYGEYRISIAKVDKDRFFTGLRDMEKSIDITNPIASPVNGIDLR